MAAFNDGDNVTAIFLNDDDESVIRVGVGKCASIRVSMENGQMAAVPWFVVYKNAEIVSKWNGALLAGVEI